MSSSKHPRYSSPVWWTVQHTILWEQELLPLRTEFERRMGERGRARIVHQGPDDSVLQNRGRAPRNVDVEHAHAVADNSWEVGTTWEQLEPGVRYGVGARAQYPAWDAWDDELEARLMKDWSEVNAQKTWDEVKRGVRQGFERASKNAR